MIIFTPQNAFESKDVRGIEIVDNWIRFLMAEGVGVYSFCVKYANEQNAKNAVRALMFALLTGDDCFTFNGED